MKRMLSALVVAAACNTATAENAQFKELEVAVVKDKFFTSAQCGDYLDGHTDTEKEELTAAAEITAIDDTLRYVAGSSDTIVSRMRKLFETEPLRFNSGLSEAQAKLLGKPDLIDSYSDSVYSKQKASESSALQVKAIDNSNHSIEQRLGVAKFMICRVATAATGLGTINNHVEQYVDYVKAKAPTTPYVAEQTKITKATVGYFEISATKAEYGKKVGTGNKYAEPKQWEGSRFLTVYASFKNLDTESRLPVSGSLLINYNGKDYKFDTVEPIMLEGYNIWFRSINPLITMKTKLVYRIPDEIHGEVFWQPGRNSNDVKLFVGSIDPQK